MEMNNNGVVGIIVNVNKNINLTYQKLNHIHHRNFLIHQIL